MSRVSQLITADVVLTVLSCLVFCLRLLARHVSGASWCWDDGFACFAWVNRNYYSSKTLVISRLTHFQALLMTENAMGFNG